MRFHSPKPPLHYAPGIPEPSSHSPHQRGIEHVRCHSPPACLPPGAGSRTWLKDGRREEGEAVTTGRSQARHKTAGAGRDGKPFTSQNKSA